MDEKRLIVALSAILDPPLAQKLTTQFTSIRQDYSTKTLGRGSPGQFVETFVQALQFLESGSYQSAPSVDVYLDQTVLQAKNIDKDLQTCAARIARAIYTLRNKRSISHNGSVDPNTFDLAFIHQGAAWIMAEILRQATKVPMQEAGALIELVQAPVGSLVEEINGTRLVHADTTIEGEILILLHSHFPNFVAVDAILESMRTRAEASVKRKLKGMKDDKLLVGSSNEGYRLTQVGHKAAIAEVTKHTS